MADIKNPVFNLSKPGADDYIYKGNLTNWAKAANTIKLKLYTQMRLVQDVKKEVTASACCSCFAHQCRKVKAL